jgi:hypothetical protein
MLYEDDTFRINHSVVQFFKGLIEPDPNQLDSFISRGQFNHIMQLLIQSGCYKINRKEQYEKDFNAAPDICLRIIKEELHNRLRKAQDMERIARQNNDWDVSDASLETVCETMDRIAEIIVSLARGLKTTELMRLSGEIESLIIRKI